MILPDVNILLAAHREEAPHHNAVRTWLAEVVMQDAAFALSDLVLAGFMRIATNPRAFNPPTTPAMAIAFADALRSRPNAVVLKPSDRHWRIFTSLCTSANARGNLVSDAYHAALAIEHGCEWITLDRDFARFPGLKWSSPADI